MKKRIDLKITQKLAIICLYALAILSFACVAMAQETSSYSGSPADVCPTPDSCIGVYQFAYSKGVFEVTKQFTMERASGELNLLWTSPEERARAEADPLGALSDLGIRMTPMVFSQMTPDDLAGALPWKLGGPPPPQPQNEHSVPSIRIHTPKWILVAMVVVVVIGVILVL
jgi:hypothetical protein